MDNRQLFYIGSGTGGADVSTDMETYILVSASS